MDFRTYLAQNAPNYLAFTGNDARIDPTKAGYDTNSASYANTSVNRQKVQGEVDQLFNKYSNAAFHPGPTYGGGGGYSPVVAPPKLDITGIYGQASSKAQGAVNPYYTKKLNDFISQQAATKQLQDQQRQFNIQNLQTDLSNKLQENDIQGTRTTQDVAQNEQQLAQTADRQQYDQGQQFSDARIQQAKQLATQGMTTSGVGQGQVQQSVQDRNLQESRQGEDTQQKQQAQELFKARTFEDLARSGSLSKDAEARGEKQQQMDWDKFVQQQGFDLTNTRDSLEHQRLADVAQEQGRQGKLLVQQFINSISNPASRLAASQAYGSLF